jgi:uncharacterized protein (TIGR03435 family)
VKPSSDSGVLSRSFTPGRFRAIGHTLGLLVSIAYELTIDRIIAPEGALTARFDVEATMPGETTRAQMLEMLRGLLEDRFGLDARREMRSMPVFALVRVRDDGRLGPQLQQVKRDCPPQRPEDRPVCSRVEATGRWIMRGEKWESIPLPLLAAGSVSAPVVDRTGLSGQVDLRLEWQDGLAGQPDNQDQRPASLEGALREQLGLKLERARADLEVLVIERISMPSGN